MTTRIDWGRSLLLTAVLLAVLFALRYIIEDSNVYLMVAVLLFVVLFLVGNLLFRRR